MQVPTQFDSYLEPVLAAREPKIRTFLPYLLDFQRWVVQEVDAQASYTDRYAPPALETYDRDGNVANLVVLNPWYESQHREVYRRGIIGLPYERGAPHLLSFTMGYLLSQADISLHCPATLTGAVAYVLSHHTNKEISSKYLPDLIRMDGQAKTGGTWATEKHGGSDIGATSTIAIPQGDRFALHGLKWFTSNANGSIALATARPEGAGDGSKGLGLYLVTSHLEDGSNNRYRVRRLKDKLGTRGLPTGEIELLGAEAIELAPPPHGLKLMMEALEYSRVHNAVGAAGIQRRSLTEALQWVRHRRAFGRSLIEFPMIQDELLGLRARFEASALLAFEAALAFDIALQDQNHRDWLRLVTALAKYLTAEDAIRAARTALELMGGNGYTSDYSLARILRDAQVLTVWEGPANIQALELMRLLVARSGSAGYEARIRAILERLPVSLSQLQRALSNRLNDDLAAITLVSGSLENTELYARKLLHRLSQSLAFALMCEEAGAADARGDSRRGLTAIRYQEEIEQPKIGSEDPRIRAATLELIED